MAEASFSLNKQFLFEASIYLIDQFFLTRCKLTFPNHWFLRVRVQNVYGTRGLRLRSLTRVEGLDGGPLRQFRYFVLQKTITDGSTSARRSKLLSGGVTGALYTRSTDSIFGNIYRDYSQNSRVLYCGYCLYSMYFRARYCGFGPCSQILLFMLPVYPQYSGL